MFPTADRPEIGAFVARRVDALRQRGLRVDVIAAPSYDAGPLRRNLRMAMNALRPRRVEGVEAHVLFPTGFIGLLAARLDRAPLLVYAHGSDVRDTSRRTPVHEFLARRVARGAAIVVANSEATARDVRRLGARAEVVPPGIDFELFAPGDRKAARDSLGLPQADQIVLYVGGLAHGKGADLFAEAIAEIPGAVGIAVGRGELEAQIAVRWPAVRLVGPVVPAAVPRWMQAADLVVVPSRAEGLGLVAVEALASGIPVIAADVGGLSEVVTQRVNGLLVPPGDVMALRQAIRDLLGSDEERGRYGAAARRSVRRHDGTVVDEEMAALWRRIGVGE